MPGAYEYDIYALAQFSYCIKARKSSIPKNIIFNEIIHEKVYLYTASFSKYCWSRLIVSLRFVSLHATATRIPFKIPLLWLIQQWSPIVFLLPLTLPCYTTWKIANSLLLYNFIISGKCWNWVESSQNKTIWRVPGRLYHTPTAIESFPNCKTDHSSLSVFS